MHASSVSNTASNTVLGLTSLSERAGASSTFTLLVISGVLAALITLLLLFLMVQLVGPHMVRGTDLHRASGVEHVVRPIPTRADQPPEKRRDAQTPLFEKPQKPTPLETKPLERPMQAQRDRREEKTVMSPPIPEVVKRQEEVQEEVQEPVAAAQTAAAALEHQEYLPIHKEPPRYPRQAIRRNIEGYVLLEYTVTKTGRVRDVTIIESYPPRVFDRAAVQSAARYRYTPRSVDGRAVEVEGVRTKIHFRLK